MQPDTLKQRFAHTTIDAQAVYEYLCADPGYVESEMDVESDFFRLIVASEADTFVTFLKQYIVGQTETLEALLMVVDLFIEADEPEARELIPLLIWAEASTLEKKEWYEFMPRLRYAQDQLKRELSIGVYTSAKSHSPELGYHFASKPYTDTSRLCGSLL